MRHSLGIVLLSIFAAVLYGELHDQVTAHLAMEYFSVYHPPVLGGLTDPFLLAVVWGFIATWWVGLFLGVPLGLSARAASLRLPPLTARDLVRPLLHLLAAMALCAFLAGVVGWQAAQNKSPALSAVRWAHNASYLSGICGGFVLCGATLRRRFIMRGESLPRQAR